MNKITGLSLKFRKDNSITFVLPDEDTDYFIECAEDALEDSWESILKDYQLIRVEISEIEEVQEVKGETDE
ncbi:hypothetical protein BH18ACI1_BH18ACI1_11910 [soil metagenome]